MKHLIILTALCISSQLFAAEAPKPRKASKLVVINDDGFSSFYSGRYSTSEDLRNQVASYRDTQVAVLEWCVTSGSRVNYPSKVSELIGAAVTDFPRRGDKLASDTLHRLAAEGVNTLQVVAGACHDAGILCYAAMRMNGDYHPGNGNFAMAPVLNSKFWWDHPQFRQRDAKGKLLTKLSYAFPEVREFKLSILREVLQQDIDGINLDFLRHPDFFGFEEPMAKAFKEKYGVEASTVAATDPRWIPLRYEPMTAFVREVRKMLDDAGQRKGNRLGLSVRVDVKKYSIWGCDVETWIKQGLLDYIVIAQYGLGGYEFDINPFVGLARGSGCAVLFGEEAHLSGHDTTAAEDKLIAQGKMEPTVRGRLTLNQYKARAARWYAAGADGVHLFNETRPEVIRKLGNVNVQVRKDVRKQATE